MKFYFDKKLFFETIKITFIIYCILPILYFFVGAMVKPYFDQKKLSRLLANPLPRTEVEKRVDDKIHFDWSKYGKEDYMYYCRECLTFFCFTPRKESICNAEEFTQLYWKELKDATLLGPEAQWHEKILFYTLLFLLFYLAIWWKIIIPFAFVPTIIILYVILFIHRHRHKV